MTPKGQRIVNKNEAVTPKNSKTPKQDGNSHISNISNRANKNCT
jgi:hypothetical protein